LQSKAAVKIIKVDSKEMIDRLNEDVLTPTIQHGKEEGFIEVFVDEHLDLIGLVNVVGKDTELRGYRVPKPAGFGAGAAMVFGVHDWHIFAEILKLFGSAGFDIDIEAVLKEPI
jgi:hypothetical protein